MKKKEDVLSGEIKNMISEANKFADAYVPGNEIVERAIEHIPEEEKEKMTGDKIITDEQMQSFLDNIENFNK